MVKYINGNKMKQSTLKQISIISITLGQNYNMINIKQNEVPIRTDIKPSEHKRVLTLHTSIDTNRLTVRYKIFHHVTRAVK